MVALIATSSPETRRSLSAAVVWPARQGFRASLPKSLPVKRMGQPRRRVRHLLALTEVRLRTACSKAGLLRDHRAL
jgi:hypothetical protein